MTAIVVGRKQLLAGLASVMPATSANGRSSATACCVRVSAVTGGLKVEAANRDLALHCVVPGDVARAPEAVAVVNARRLRSSILRGLPAGDIGVSIDATRLSIAAGSTTIWLESQRDEDWPGHPAAKGETLSLTAADVAAVKQVASCASTDDFRPILNAVLLANGSSVATDSYRLMAAKVAVVPPAPVLLPLAAVRSLPDRDLSLCVSDAVAWWGDDMAGGSALLVRGDFPRWEGLFPTKRSPVVTFDRPALLAAALRADAALGGDSSIPLRLALSSLLSVDLTAGTKSNRIFSEAMGARASDHHDPICFNARFLAAMARNFAGPRIHMAVQGPLPPALFTDDDSTARGLLMPVRES